MPPTSGKTSSTRSRAWPLSWGYCRWPLAQVAAYLTDRDLDCAGYRGRLADRRRTLPDLAPDDSGLPDDHRTTLAATWSLSIEQADRLRSAYSMPIGDQDWEEDIRRLASLSREFAELWERHEVAEPEPRVITYQHPRAGALSLAVSELSIPDMPEARILVYTPRDDDTPGQAAADAPDGRPRPAHRLTSRGPGIS